MKAADTVYNAWEGLKKQNLYLILAGKVDTNLPLPNDPNIIYLGELTGEKVGLLFQALDVGIIAAHDSEFGKYCFPQKMYEMIASDLPFVAAKIGDMSELLLKHPEIQYNCGDVAELIKAVNFQIDNRLLYCFEALSWSELVSSLEASLLSLKKCY